MACELSTRIARSIGSALRPARRISRATPSSFTTKSDTASPVTGWFALSSTLTYSVCSVVCARSVDDAAMARARARRKPRVRMQSLPGSNRQAPARPSGDAAEADGGKRHRLSLKYRGVTGRGQARPSPETIADTGLVVVRSLHEPPRAARCPGCRPAAGRRTVGVSSQGESGGRGLRRQAEAQGRIHDGLAV